ncbi:MAG: Mth938-like domain-containing protein [Lysobacterales bacterium]|jgi:uncharacterized protein
MEFHLEVPGHHHFIRSIGERGIRINDDYHTGALIVSAEKIIPGWAVESVGDIDQASLQPVFELDPDVVLIGTGATQVFLPPETQMLFYRRGIGFEVMSTDAACRTFNVLVAEGRPVAAALLPIS